MAQPVVLVTGTSLSLAVLHWYCVHCTHHEQAARRRLQVHAFADLD